MVGFPLSAAWWICSPYNVGASRFVSSHHPHASSGSEEASQLLPCINSRLNSRPWIFTRRGSPDCQGMAQGFFQVPGGVQDQRTEAQTPPSLTTPFKKSPACPPPSHFRFNIYTRDVFPWTALLLSSLQLRFRIFFLKEFYWIWSTGSRSLD